MASVVIIIAALKLSSSLCIGTGGAGENRVHTEYEVSALSAAREGHSLPADGQML